jgi:uncharacterized membrane protein
VAEPTRDGKPTENIFRIMDEIVYQLNKTKKIFIIMIVTIIIAVPLTHIMTSALLGGPFMEDRFDGDRFGPPGGDSFRVAQAIIAAVVIVWIVIGIRQWLVLSKWTKKYRQYKELQKKIDEKLDYDEGEDQPSSKS